MMMADGRTEAEEQEDLRRQIQNFENDPSVIISIMLIVVVIVVVIVGNHSCYADILMMSRELSKSALRCPHLSPSPNI